MEFAFLILVVLLFLVLGFAAGWFACAKYTPTFLAKLSKDDLTALASKVADRREKV